MSKTKKQTRREQRETLTAAMVGGDLIRYQTRTDGDVWEFGHVFGLNKRFLLLQRVSKDVFLDGYTVLPRCEIRQADSASDFLLERALPLFGYRPAPPNEIQLDDWRSLVASVDVHFPLASVETGRIEAGCLFIGRVAKIKNRSFLLREISVRAVWDKSPMKHRFRDITRVNFGGRYEAALWRVAQSENAVIENQNS